MNKYQNGLILIFLVNVISSSACRFDLLYPSRALGEEISVQYKWKPPDHRQENAT